MSWLTRLPAIGTAIAKGYDKAKQLIQRKIDPKTIEEKKVDNAMQAKDGMPEKGKETEPKIKAHEKAEKLKEQLNEKGMNFEAEDAKEITPPSSSPNTDEGDGRYRGRSPWEDSHNQSPDYGHDNGYEQGMDL